MLPKEWLGFSLGSSQSEAGSLFFLLPKSFLKGWNLPAFFLSADDKTERRGARRGSRLRGGMRSKSEAPARSSPALALAMLGCCLLCTPHIDTAEAAALQPLLLALRMGMELPAQPNVCMDRKDHFAKPESNSAMFLGFIPQL